MACRMVQLPVTLSEAEGHLFCFVIPITTTTTTILQPTGLCPGPGLPRWAGTRKVKPIWIYWSKI